jgi:hypothetical protein
MRKLLISFTTLVVVALGLGGAFLVFSPGAGAHDLVDGTFTGSVGSSGANPDAYIITLNTPATVAPGTYQLNITDYSSIHNFDLCAGPSCTGSNSLDKTDVAGTGSVSWIVNLTPGTYTYQCDVHFHQLQEQFVVGTVTTPLNASITKVTSTRKLVTVNAKANRPASFKAVLLKASTVLATATTSGRTTAQLKLKPLKALKPGYYVVQVKAFTSNTNFKVVKKKIYVM